MTTPRSTTAHWLAWDANSAIQPAEPAGVALHAGRLEGDDAARVRGQGRVHGHLRPQVRRESLFYFLGYGATCAEYHMQPAKFYACEYAPPGNVIGQFPCVASRCASRTSWIQY